MRDALAIWEALVKVHCEKGVNIEARRIIKGASLGDVTTSEMVTDFEDDTPVEEVVMFGNRRALRQNSEFYHFFNRIIDKIENGDQNSISITNALYAPDLIKFLARQYLSLFPLLSAAVLKEGGLKSNAHIELYWKGKRAIMAKVPTPQHWPAKLIGIQHHETRKLAKEIHLHSIIPDLKFGGKKLSAKKSKHSDLLKEKEMGSENMLEKYFMPIPSKKERKERRNESFDGSKEKWGPKKAARLNSNPYYMKNKVIDHEKIQARLETSGNVDTIRVTGNVTKGGVVLKKNDIAWLRNKNNYVSDNTIDAGLLLLDKRFNNPNLPQTEDVNVYSIQDLRMILSGVEGIVKPGKFLCIIPRDFALNMFDQMQTQLKEQSNISNPGGHFTLISSMYCDRFEVSCFETFQPFRNKDNLLTREGMKLIRLLFGLKESDKQVIEVNCVNVATQTESECGVLALAIASQLCFHQPLGGVFHQILNVREHMFECLQRNELTDFVTRPNSIIDETLFTINI